PWPSWAVRTTSPPWPAPTFDWGELRMFEPGSRYAALPQATLTTSDGRTVAYVRRRFLPQGRSVRLLTEVTVAEGERLDILAYRTLGDPERFWQVCDANDAM